MAKRKKSKVPHKKKVVPISLELPSVSRTRLNPVALGYTAGILHGVSHFVLAVLARNGYALEAFAVVQKFHVTYSTTTLGIVGGIAEAALMGLVMGMVVGWLYNKMT